MNGRHDAREPVHPNGHHAVDEVVSNLVLGQCVDLIRVTIIKNLKQPDFQ